MFQQYQGQRKEEIRGYSVTETALNKVIYMTNNLVKWIAEILFLHRNNGMDKPGSPLAGELG